MVEQSRQWDEVSDQISVEEAAEVSGYSAEYIRRLIRKGNVEAQHKGTMYWVNRDSLRAYLEEMEHLGRQRFNWRRAQKQYSES
jgi:excisionase family DNA binding protein